MPERMPGASEPSHKDLLSERLGWFPEGKRERAFLVDWLDSPPSVSDLMEYVEPPKRETLGQNLTLNPIHFSLGGVDTFSDKAISGTTVARGDENIIHGEGQFGYALKLKRNDGRHEVIGVIGFNIDFQKSVLYILQLQGGTTNPREKRRTNSSPQGKRGVYHSSREGRRALLFIRYRELLHDLVVQLAKRHHIQLLAFRKASANYHWHRRELRHSLRKTYDTFPKQVGYRDLKLWEPLRFSHLGNYRICSPDNIHNPREENSEADALVNSTLARGR